MRASRFTEAQTSSTLEQAKGGARFDDLAREHGIRTQTIDNWRAKYGGLEVSEAKRLRELEEENRRLKKLVADLSLDKEALKDPLGRN